MARSGGGRKKSSSSRSGGAKAKAGASSEPQTVRPSANADDRASAAQEFARLHIWEVQAFRDVLVFAAVVGIVWFGYVLRTVTVPLLVALLLAYLFEPVVSRLTERREVSRAAVVAGLLACVVASVVLATALALPLVVGQSVELVNDVRGGVFRDRIAKVSRFLPEGYVDDFERFLAVLPGAARPPETAGGTGPAAPGTEGDVAQAEPAEPETGEVETALTEDRVREIVRQQVREQSLRESAEWAPTDWLGIARGGSRTAARVIGAVLGAGLVAFLIPFYFFFFSLWYPAVVRFLRNLLPERNRRRTLELLEKMDRVVSGFVRGRIIISLIMGVMLAVGWWICGVPYAPVVGLVIGVFCAVPYLGAVGAPLAGGLLFFERLGAPDSGALWWLWVLLWPTVVFVAVQLVEGYVLTPAIAGKVTNLDPVTILVAVLAGGSVLGVYGMLLAIPVAACLKILFTEVLLPKIHAWARGEAADPLPIGKR
ncbi:MAG: AI-2E family transporter [Planctomycetota bacterium]|jgi:predicted PurR-regulated permease PerM